MNIDGTIATLLGRCPGVTVVVHTTIVVADGDTSYSKGACKDLRILLEVSVTGTVQPDHTVKATRIEIKNKNNNDN